MRTFCTYISVSKKPSTFRSCPLGEVYNYTIDRCPMCMHACTHFINGAPKKKNQILIKKRIKTFLY